MPKEKNITLEVARIIAVFAVVMIHCSGVFVSQYDVSSYEFLWGNIFDSISRIGVPFFLMISGSLMLDEKKKIPLKLLFSRYLKNIVLITFAWAVIFSLIYQCVLPLLQNETVTIHNIFRDIITGHYHMWYLYMFIGIYFALPFLKAFVCKENKNLVLLFIGISLVTQFTVPLLDVFKSRFSVLAYTSSLLKDFQLHFFAGYLSYYLAGWYIVHIGIQKKWIRLCLYILSALSLVGMILYIQHTGNYNAVYENVGLPVFLYSVGAFLALSRVSFKLNDFWKNLIMKFSGLTFGVYMVHVIAITLYSRIFPYTKLPVLYNLAFLAAVAFTSFGVCFLLSKIPFIKKLIRM